MHGFTSPCFPLRRPHPSFILLSLLPYRPTWNSTYIWARLYFLIKQTLYLSTAYFHWGFKETVSKKCYAICSWYLLWVFHFHNILNTLNIEQYKCDIFRFLDIRMSRVLGTKIIFKAFSFFKSKNEAKNLHCEHALNRDYCLWSITNLSVISGMFCD